MTTKTVDLYEDNAGGLYLGVNGKIWALYSGIEQHTSFRDDAGSILAGTADWLREEDGQHELSEAEREQYDPDHVATMASDGSVEVFGAGGAAARYLGIES